MRSPGEAHRPMARLPAMCHPLRTSRALSFTVFAVVALTLVLLYRASFHSRIAIPTASRPEDAAKDGSQDSTKAEIGPETSDTNLIADMVQYFTDFPPRRRQRVFGVVGRRCVILRDWIGQFDKSRDEFLRLAIEETALSLFPHLHNRPEGAATETPIADFRARAPPGTSGIVVPTGLKTLRFAAHLIVCLRTVLNSNLPIQIVYAGDDDLRPSARAQLVSFFRYPLPHLPFSISPPFSNESSTQLRNGGWAIKAFAALASPFERTILLDADAVFLQAPEVLLASSAFARTGALLFHDRLLWQHAFSDRHDWWKSQIRRPSPALDTSRVWNEDYAEEGDSGAVVIDKSRTDVFVGLLHIAWQNSYAVREEVTYKITYGDKESWWLGFELAGSKYEFEQHYGSIVGWEETHAATGTSMVCSFVIAHVDEDDRLIWYNGGLLKNKQQPDMKHVYEIPQKWMLEDGVATWVKGERKEDMSCMIGGPLRTLSEQELAVLGSSITKAKEIDEILSVA